MLALHRNNISGQRGSKPRVSEHESSAPPVDMDQPSLMCIYTHIYIRIMINFGVGE